MRFNLNNPKTLNIATAVAAVIAAGILLNTFIKKGFRKINPKGKTIAFIGDSHTTGCGWGYQSLLAKNYGFTEANLAEGGRVTSWCLQVLKAYLGNYQVPTWLYKKQPCPTSGFGKKPDIVMIFAGGNDAYNTSISMETATKNIQSMVDLCNEQGIKSIVIVGYNAEKVQVNNPLTQTTVYVRTQQGMWELGKRNYQFQLDLPKKIKNAIVVPAWDGVKMSDSSDGIHLSGAAHKRFADYIGNYVFTKD